MDISSNVNVAAFASNDLEEKIGAILDKYDRVHRTHSRRTRGVHEKKTCRTTDSTRDERMVLETILQKRTGRHARAQRFRGMPDRRRTIVCAGSATTQFRLFHNASVQVDHRS